MHPNKILSLFLIVTICCLATSCGTTTELPNDDGQLAPLVTRVLDRHDKWIAEDAGLGAQEKAAATAEALLVRDAFKAKAVNVAPIYDHAMTCLQRYDDYASLKIEDPDLKGLALLSSENIRRSLRSVETRPAK